MLQRFYFSVRDYICFCARARCNYRRLFYMWMQMLVGIITNHHLQSSEASQGGSCDFLTLSVTGAVVPAVRKTKGAKTVSLVRDTSPWLMQQPQCGVVAPHPRPPGQDPLPSLHITQWPETKRGREAKKKKKKKKKETSTISSIFLMNPIFCLRAKGALVRPRQL